MCIRDRQKMIKQLSGMQKTMKRRGGRRNPFGGFKMPF